MACDCGNALIAILVISDVGKKKMSSQVISMKDLHVVFDVIELLKIIDKMKYNIMMLETGGEAVLHKNQSEIQEKKSNTVVRVQ